MNENHPAVRAYLSARMSRVSKAQSHSDKVKAARLGGLAKARNARLKKQQQPTQIP